MAYYKTMGFRQISFVLTTQPDQNDNRIKDHQNDEDFRCSHRAPTGQRRPTDQDLSRYVCGPRRMASPYLAPRQLLSLDH